MTCFDIKNPNGGPESTKKTPEKHGHAKPQSPTYKAWAGMRSRCGNPNLSAFKHYGGRGIKVCARWQHSFVNFLSDMGKRPAGMELERINNDGDYELGNCRWATRKEQLNNTRQNHFVTFQGRTQTLAQWAEEIGMPYHVLESRLRFLKWPIERAFTEEVHYKNGMLPREKRTGRFC